MVCSFRQAAARRCCRSRERSSGSESTESAIEAIGPKKEKWALTACGSVYARGRHETRTAKSDARALLASGAALSPRKPVDHTQYTYTQNMPQSVEAEKR